MMYIRFCGGFAFGFFKVFIFRFSLLGRFFALYCARDNDRVARNVAKVANVQLNNDAISSKSVISWGGGTLGIVRFGAFSLCESAQFHSPFWRTFKTLKIKRLVLAIKCYCLTGGTPENCHPRRLSSVDRRRQSRLSSSQSASDFERRHVDKKDRPKTTTMTTTQIPRQSSRFHDISFVACNGRCGGFA